MNLTNIVLAGVGGQGILLAAEILGSAAVKGGYNVRVSELHGMAQRGGAVVTHVRVGDKALAPTILDGTADVIVGFEPMETLRNIRYVSQETIIVMNTHPYKIGGAKYPAVEEIIDKTRFFTKKLVKINALALSEQAGASVTQNAVMLGALAATGKLQLEVSHVRKALKELVPKRFVDVNLRAFDLGWKATQAKIPRIDCEPLANR
ncbi:MAG: indolepyruvate oxidoreductase subunit beta [Candidatus Bathyarchaeota archaeon]|nr:indolepyruvate oxidoreductase subunit beta [Candidatus Bathyarchaeota archaeon]